MLIQQKFAFSRVSVYHFACQVLNILEVVHRAGVVYNDLKFDNLLLSYKQEMPKDFSSVVNCFSNVQLNLIDFGLAQSFIDRKTGKHLNREVERFMKGNFMFGSIDQLNFYRTSRRDDLLGLCYMLIWMLNGGDLPDLDFQMLNNQKLQPLEKLAIIKDYK